MLKLGTVDLADELATYLNDQQADIDGQADYATQVERARVLWKGRSAATFLQIRAALVSLCHGAQRCHYCEDSVGDEVEHVRPQAFYPSQSFRWTNYLYSCGQCNGANKRDRFAIFDTVGAVVELTRSKDAPVVAPPDGPSVFIDPRVDDPVEFLELDLDTGLFLPRIAPPHRDHLRARFTIDVLGLNRRDYLSKSRRNAFASYVDSARQYVTARASGASAAELAQRQKDIAERHHRSVWFEMKRLATTEFREIFGPAPELLQI